MLLLSHLILSCLLIIFSSYFLFLLSIFAIPLSPLLPISTPHSYLPTPHHTPHSPSFLRPISTAHSTPYHTPPLFFPLLSMRRLEVSLDRLANRLEAMAVHHEQQFASAVDNIGDIEVIYIHPFKCYCLVLLFLLLILLLLFSIVGFLLFCCLSLIFLQSISHIFSQSLPLSPLPSFLLSVHEPSS